MGIGIGKGGYFSTEMFRGGQSGIKDLYELPPEVKPWHLTFRVLNVVS